MCAWLSCKSTLVASVHWCGGSETVGRSTRAAKRPLPLLARRRQEGWLCGLLPPDPSCTSCSPAALGRLGTKGGVERDDRRLDWRVELQGARTLRLLVASVATRAQHRCQSAARRLLLESRAARARPALSLRPPGACAISRGGRQGTGAAAICWRGTSRHPPSPSRRCCRRRLPLTCALPVSRPPSALCLRRPALVSAAG